MSTKLTNLNWTAWSIFKDDFLKKWLFLLSLIVLAVLFSKPITSQISLFIAKNIDGLFLVNLYYKLPNLEWIYNNPNQRFIYLLVMSLSALFIAPLNSINNTIKDGNLLQVAYIRERFNYAIITRYLLVLPAIIFVENIIFSTLSLIFVVGDIIYFYRSYANFIFNNNKVMVSFLTDKIKEEDKTRADFLQSFKDFKKTILRYERKNKSLHTSYNNRWTFTSQSGVQDVDRHKLKHFLVALNHRLEINLETNKDNNQQRRFRNFSSNIFFNLRDLKISLSIDYQQITKSETDNNLFVGLKNEFYEAFDYLKKNEGKSILPHLMDGLDIHFLTFIKKMNLRFYFLI